MVREKKALQNVRRIFFGSHQHVPIKLTEKTSQTHRIVLNTHLLLFIYHPLNSFHHDELSSSELRYFHFFFHDEKKPVDRKWKK